MKKKIRHYEWGYLEYKELSTLFLSYLLKKMQNKRRDKVHAVPLVANK